MIRSAHASVGSARTVHGSSVVKSVAPASVSSASFFSSTSLCERRLGEMTVDELHRHRALTNGGGASLGRARADVTSGEDARNTGLERVLGSRSSAREDEAVIVACDRVVEPIGARLG